MANEQITKAVRIESLILIVRGLRVMTDSDLAGVYNVALKRLNEQVSRNAGRFPKDFAFQLTRQEFANLKSQFATSSSHGGKRKLPSVFTEHGAIMLASVLNSPVAVAASIAVVRAFVRLRELVITHKDLAVKLEELEKKVKGHDEALKNVFHALRQIMTPPRRAIGFHVRHVTDAPSEVPPTAVVKRR